MAKTSEGSAPLKKPSKDEDSNKGKDKEEKKVDPIDRNTEQDKIGDKIETDNESINVDRNEDIIKQDSTFIDDLIEKSEHANRGGERGIINDKNGSSIILKDSGDISIASDKMAQVSIIKDTKSINQISQQQNIITNRLTIDTNDIEIKDHKINQRIWELADQRTILSNSDHSIGNFNVGGYVLMKHWEADLGKWVMIRRKIRMPLFYPEKTLPDAPKNMDINSKIDLSDKPLVGDLADLLEDTFGLDEKDPSFQAAENNVEIDEDALVLDTQILDPKEDVILDMGPIDSNTNIESGGNADIGGGLGGGSLDEGFNDIGGGGSGGNPINLLDGSLSEKQKNYNKTQTVTHKMPPGYETSQPNDSRVNPIPPDVLCYNIDKVGDLNLSTHFKLSQFRSGCGSPYVLISPLLIQKLEQLCSALGVSYIKINSGYRSPAHNEAIKKQGYKAANKSQHLFGRASDLWVSNSVSPSKIAAQAKKLNFQYVYYKSGFCHVNV